MKIRIGLIASLLFSCILISAGLAFSQEEAEKLPAQEASSETDTQWVWGDTVSIDPAGRTMLVKYLDYENDIEKEINITVDDKTNYESVKSIDEIKPQDTVSVDYITNGEGKNIAKNISVERPEASGNLPEESVSEEPEAVQRTE